jgi:DNA-binding transcriptional LysR family regulator
MIEQEFGESGMKTPANLVECTSIFAALQLLQKSDAVTLLPESAVRDHLRAGLLVRLALDVGISWPGFGILTRRGESMGLAATEFTQLLRKYGTMMSRSELAIIKPVRQRRR